MINVDKILASLGPEFDELDDSPWGSANLTPCGDPDCDCASWGEIE